MGAIHDFDREKLIVGVIYSDTDVFEKAMKMLTDAFGETDGVCEEFSFPKNSQTTTTRSLEVKV